MSEDKKDGTKNVPPPTDAEAPGRVTAETVVTEGPRGIDRLKSLMRRLVHDSGG